MNSELSRSDAMSASFLIQPKHDRIVRADLDRAGTFADGLILAP
jgi:hypothetical protein